MSFINYSLPVHESTICVYSNTKNSYESLVHNITTGNYIKTVRTTSHIDFYGCFSDFRYKKANKKYFYFTHSLYLPFMEKFVKDWNEMFDAVKLIIKSEIKIPIFTRDGFDTYTYTVTNTGKEPPFYLPCYIFTTKIPEEIEHHNIMINYLTHHVIRILSLSENSCKKLLKNKGLNLVDFDSINNFYDKLGLLDIIKIFNDFASNPRRLFNGNISTSLIKKIFMIGTWKNFELSSQGYRCQTDTINYIAKLITVIEEFEINKGDKFYVKGRKIYDREFTIVNSNLIKAQIIGGTASENIVEIKVLEHKYPLYVGRKMFVRNNALIPINEEDANDMRCLFKYNVNF